MVVLAGEEEQRRLAARLGPTTGRYLGYEQSVIIDVYHFVHSALEPGDGIGKGLISVALREFRRGRIIKIPPAEIGGIILVILSQNAHTKTAILSKYAVHFPGFQRNHNGRRLQTDGHKTVYRRPMNISIFVLGTDHTNAGSEK